MTYCVASETLNSPHNRKDASQKSCILEDQMGISVTIKSRKKNIWECELVTTWKYHSSV